jgi:hypothetical protein
MPHSGKASSSRLMKRGNSLPVLASEWAMKLAAFRCTRGYSVVRRGRWNRKASDTDSRGARRLGPARDVLAAGIPPARGRRPARIEAPGYEPHDAGCCERPERHRDQVAHVERASQEVVRHRPGQPVAASKAHEAFDDPWRIFREHSRLRNSLAGRHFSGLHGGASSLAAQHTDQFLDELYDFRPELGVTVVAATHSRRVADEPPGFQSQSE